MDGIDIRNSDPEVTFTDCQNPVDGDGNISADPLFVKGPNDNYRLAHQGTGDPVDSPCIDSGGEFATERVFELFGNIVSLDKFSTRSDSMPDTGMTDMGYHDLSQDLQLNPAVQIVMNPYFHPGDDFQVKCRIYNPGETMVNVPVACAVRLDGVFYLWPHWTTGFDYQIMEIPQGMIELPIFPECIWPDTGEARDGNCWIYSAMLTDDFGHIRGCMDALQWGYGPNGVLKN